MLKFSKDDDSTSATSKPSNQEVVNLMCKHIKTEKRFSKKKGKTETYVIYECPRKSLCSNEHGHIALLKGKGFTNGFNHLKSCCAGGSLTALYELYQSNYNRQQSTVGTHFVPLMDITPKERKMIEWITLIVHESSHLSVVEDPDYRKFKNDNTDICARTLKAVILTMVEIVEPKIGRQMKIAGRGSILHDGWTKDSVHYVGSYCCYIRAITTVVKGKKLVEELPKLIILACSPMASIEVNELDTMKEDY